MIRVVLTLALSVAAFSQVVAAAKEPAREPTAADMHKPGDFTSLWWANGPIDYMGKTGPSKPPVLCFQSGSLGFALDTKSLRVLHAGRLRSIFKEVPSTAEAKAAMQRLPEAPLQLSVRRNGKWFHCVGRGPEPKDVFFFPVRFVETGRFLQHVVIDGLEFADAQGEKLGVQGHLEIAFWPDRLRLTLLLDKSGVEGITELSIRSAERTSAVSLDATRSVALSFFEPERAPFRIEGSSATNVSWNALLNCWHVRVQQPPWQAFPGAYPEAEFDRLNRWSVVLHNDTAQEVASPVLFDSSVFPAITGFTPMLLEPDGTPTGLPLQLSKNWHVQPDKGEMTYQGPWAHASAFIRMPPHSTRKLDFALTYARWGGIPAASHAQLCLIGWGHNQFWDQAAIGSFGESICFEPGRIQRRCFIDDIRSFMTKGAEGGKEWTWTDNGGGGDFLMWIDEKGVYRGFKTTRTDYRAHGPCLTDVRYSEETSDGEITAQMTASIARSDDYLRTFHRIRYDVHAPVSWKRLAFYQMGADFYNAPPARRVGIGDGANITDEWEPVLGNDVFDRRSVPMKGTLPWAAIWQIDTNLAHKADALVTRGLIVRSWKAVMGGKKVTSPHLTTYATEWGAKNYRTAVELSTPPEVTQLLPGDFVEAELELVMFPAIAQDCYSPDKEYREALAKSGDSWALTAREASGNQLQVKVAKGKLLSAYPVVIKATGKGTAEFAVQGGLGFVPITVKGLKSYRGVRLHVNGSPLDQSVHGNDFWQTEFDALTKTWALTWNVRIPNRSAVLRIE